MNKEIEEALKAIVYELIQELDYNGRSDHQALVIEALKTCGLDDEEIKGVLSGNLIL